jgi:uncharacterized protein (TIGR03435 family)
MKRKMISAYMVLAALACIVLPTASTLSSAVRTPVQAQTTTPTPDDPKFVAFAYDVVSIKPYKDNMEDPKATAHWMGSRESEDGFTLHNAPISVVIAQAYHTEHSRLSGAPDWVNKDRYEIEAKMSSEVVDAFQKLSVADQKLARQHMLRILARDYLKLTFHMEVTEVQIYEMVVGKNGSKLKPADPNAPEQGMRVSGGGGVTTWDGKNTALSSMMGQLTYVMGRPVYDKTGLTGRYDFQVKYSSDRAGAGSPDIEAAAPPDAAPPIMIALEEQLGLKLVSGKGPMDIIVIDHLDRPAMN